MFCVYILQSIKDNKLYIGSTSNLKKRFKEHSEGRVKSTSYRRPLELIYYEAYKEEEIARKRERIIEARKSTYRIKETLRIN